MMSNLSIQAPEAEPVKSAVVQTTAPAARPQQAPQTRAPAVSPSKPNYEKLKKNAIYSTLSSPRSRVAAHFTQTKRKLQSQHLQYNKLGTREIDPTKSVLRIG